MGKHLQTPLALVPQSVGLFYYVVVEVYCFLPIEGMLETRIVSIYEEVDFEAIE